MDYENTLYDDSVNIIKAFRDCAEKYGKKFTVDEYREYVKENNSAPTVYEIFAKTRFNKIKRFLFGEESLNRRLHSIEEIKRNYRVVCDRNGGRPLNIGEYGRRKDDDMVKPSIIRKRTTSNLLKRWYKQKKKDELLGTNKAESMRVRRNDNRFKSFCGECAEDKNTCGYNRETCPYWNDKILGE